MCHTRQSPPAVGIIPHSVTPCRGSRVWYDDPVGSPRHHGPYQRGVAMISARRLAEHARLNEARFEALLKLGQMTGAPLQEITDFSLEQAVLLTGSQIGYLAFMNGDETVLTMHSWSKTAMKECAIADKPLIYPVETTGLWGEAVRQRKPIVTNDYSTPDPLKKGLPEGHVGLSRHMNVPIFEAGHIVIVAGVGNKAAEYDESDVRQLTLLMEGMWLLLQRHRAEAELRRHRDQLEQLVKERAAELVVAHEALQHSHAELQALYNGMADGLLIADLETRRFVRANAAICRMLDCSEKEVLSMSVMGVPLVADSPAVWDEFRELAEGQRWRSENVPIRPRMERSSTLTSRPIISSTKAGLAWPASSTTPPSARTPKRPCCGSGEFSSICWSPAITNVN